MGATQGLLSALVADAAPADLRGTAFGVFNLASGVALLAASVIAGGLWTVVGPAMTFYAGAAFSAVALLGLLARRGERGRPWQQRSVDANAATGCATHTATQLRR